jgi:hypothetical protein
VLDEIRRARSRSTRLRAVLGKRSFVTAAAAAAAVVVFACSSPSVYIPPAAPFPYGGPSCTGVDFNGNCWLCAVEECPTQVTCIQPDAGTCGEYFSCFCACAEGDTNCHASCAKDENASCTSCEQTLAACEAASCGAVCGNGGPPSSDAAVSVGDARADGTVEAGADAAPEAAADATVESGAEAGREASTDAAPEAGMEAGSDAAHESGVDAESTESGVESGAATEGGADATSD